MAPVVVGMPATNPRTKEAMQNDTKPQTKEASAHLQQAWYARLASCTSTWVHVPPEAPIIPPVLL